MKIIFLDIDGVLNSHGWVHQHGDHTWLSMLDPDRIELLNQITKRTGAKLVISSSWRIFHGHTPLALLLQQAGVEGEVYDVTPTGHGLRGREIQAWLDAQPEQPEAIVILDDCKDMGHLMDRLVQTNGAKGLQPYDVWKSIEMLEGTR